EAGIDHVAHGHAASKTIAERARPGLGGAFDLRFGWPARQQCRPGAAAGGVGVAQGGAALADGGAGAECEKGGECKSAEHHRSNSAAVAMPPAVHTPMIARLALRRPSSSSVEPR